MNGAVILWAALVALWTAIIEGFRERPLLTSACIVFLLAMTASMWRALEREGWKAAAWGAVSAAAFAVIWVVA